MKEIDPNNFIELWHVNYVLNVYKSPIRLTSDGKTSLEYKSWSRKAQTIYPWLITSRGVQNVDQAELNQKLDHIRSGQTVL